MADGSVTFDEVPGGTNSITLNLPPGEYEFIYPVPGHEEVGMVGLLHVVREQGEAAASVTPDADLPASPVGGTALSILPADDPNSLNVVASGVMSGLPAEKLWFVMRNNTPNDQEALIISVVVRSAQGDLVAADASTEVNPRLVVAGGVAFGYGEFKAEIQPDAVFEWRVMSSPAGRRDQSIRRDLEVMDAR